MEITEIKIFHKDAVDKKLRAYATVTFDNVFVVRNIKVIEGEGGLFIAMPSRKVKEACLKCKFKNEIRSRFCNYCGAQLPVNARPDASLLDKAEHRDIAHPITQGFREQLQRKILDTYAKDKPSGAGNNLGLHNLA